MLDQLDLSKSDRRILAMVVGFMAILMFALTDGSVTVRVIVGITGGLIAGVVYVVTTILLNRLMLKPR